MATTKHFQVKPNFYPTKEECVASLHTKANTNPRYKQFNQTHFTAGDIDQFMTYKDPTNGQVCLPDISMDKNLFEKYDFSTVIDWEKYKDLDAIAVTNTFYYMFNKFKKGIFIKIKNNKLAVFLPFSKRNFTNEWFKNIYVDPKYGDIIGFVRHIHELEGRRFNPRSVNKFIESWYANNCLVRYEYPINEGDTNHPNMYDMFETLCANREIPDIEFFVNRRDFPMLKKNATEAYEDMFGSNQPLLSHDYQKYSPILSMVSRDGYADIPIPTGEDWSRIGSLKGKYFPKACREYLEEFKLTPWDQRRPTAVFRGGSTGCGVTINTNPRLKLAYLSQTTPPDSDGIPLLDAGITNWNLRPRKLEGEKYLQTIDIDSLQINRVNRLTPQEQTKYKYLINVDGHVSAFRLSLEMGMGCCILLVDSNYKLWYQNMLIPYKHYVPVKGDLSNLIQQIKWCKAHDKKCHQIATNAKRFHDTYLLQEGVLDYLQKLLYDLKKYNGIYLYNQRTPFQVQVKNEKKQIELIYPDTNKTVADIQEIPLQQRCFGMLQGVHWMVNMVNDRANFFQLASKQQEIFHSRLSTIDEYSLAGFPFAVKLTEDPEKVKESVHEVFVGVKCVNDLCKYLPNFMYTFGGCHNGDVYSVLTERIVGQTFSAYIQSPDFTMRNYLFILLQLGFALHVAQQRCGLVHYDLTPWNIIIQRLPQPITVDYIMSSKTVARVTTQIIPVIIDYGKSHVIYENKHYGDINMYTTSTIQDILSILVTSVYEITNRENLKHQDITDLITLANFLSGTQYRPRPFFRSGKNDLGELRYFFRNAKRYTELINTNKFELEKKTPVDFVEYVFNKFKGFSVQKVSNLKYTLNQGNSRQVFEYILSKNTKERVKSFTNVFERIKYCDLPDTDNVLFAYFVLQNIRTNLESVYNFMLAFLEANNIPPKQYVKKYASAIKHISHIYENVIGTEDYKDIKYDFEPYSVLIPAPYNSETFIRPEEIKVIRNSMQKPENNLAPYKEMIEETLLYEGVFQMPVEAVDFYRQNCKELLDCNCLYLRNNIANYWTLTTTITDIYTRDRKALIKKLEQEKSGDCIKAQNYLELYNQLLE